MSASLTESPIIWNFKSIGWFLLLMDRFNDKIQCFFNHLQQIFQLYHYVLHIDCFMIKVYKKWFYPAQIWILTMCKNRGLSTYFRKYSLLTMYVYWLVKVSVKIKNYKTMQSWKKNIPLFWSWKNQENHNAFIIIIS